MRKLKKNSTLHKETRLAQIQSTVGVELEFEKLEKNNQIYYISEYQRDENDFSDLVYGCAALILNQKELGGMHIVYTPRCWNCEDLKKSDFDKAYDWLIST